MLFLRELFKWFPLLQHSAYYILVAVNGGSLLVMLLSSPNNERLLLPNLIDVELLHQVKVGALPVQVPVCHGFNPLLLQAVHHIIVGVLIREPSQGLPGTKHHFSLLV